MAKHDKVARQRKRLRAVMRGAFVTFDGNTDNQQKAFKRLGAPMTRDELDVFMGLSWRWRIVVTFTWSGGHHFEIDFVTDALHELADLGGVLDQLQDDNQPGDAEFIKRVWRATIVH